MYAYRLPLLRWNLPPLSNSCYQSLQNTSCYVGRAAIWTFHDSQTWICDNEIWRTGTLGCYGVVLLDSFSCCVFLLGTILDCRRFCLLPCVRTWSISLPSLREEVETLKQALALIVLASFPGLSQSPREKPKKRGLRQFKLPNWSHIRL